MSGLISRLFTTTFFPKTICTLRVPFGYSGNIDFKMLVTFLLPLLPLISTVLALPYDSTSSNHTNTLEKRFNYAWIGSTDPNDPECKGAVLEKGKHDRPKLYQTEGSFQYECEEIHRDGGRNIKVFWGSGQYEVNQVSLFYGPGCGDRDYAKVFTRKGDQNTYECFDMRADKREWKSVRARWHF